MSLITKGTSGSQALRAVTADTGELRTASHNAALSVLIAQEQTRTGGF
ncbi:MAG: hypothetical protein M8352_09740 [ANME-2 cluster archaeon]|nr:hypothetical protein [ANME-2 cluster archaeon]